MLTIRLFATLRDIAGSKTLAVPFESGGTVRDLIEAIWQVKPELAAKILDEDEELTGLVHIFVHGRNIIWLDGLDTVITGTDDLVLIPPVAGG